MGQPAFELAEFMPYRLSVASNAVSRAVARAYAGRFGLTTPEWRVLAVVAGEAEGLPQSTLAARTGMDKMTISRAVAALAGRGLLARGRDAADARTPRLNATPEGRRVYDEVVPAARAVEAGLLDGIDADEIAAAMVVVERLRAAAEAACREP